MIKTRNVKAPEAGVPPKLRSVRSRLSEADDLARSVGARLKVLRIEAGFTLEELAARAGVSRAMLSKVERAEKSPTLAVFVRIAKGLDVSFSTMMGGKVSGAKAEKITVAQRLRFKDAESGFERSVLSPAHAGGRVELLQHRIPAGKSSGTLPAYKAPTEKYLVVQSGRLCVCLGRKKYNLNAGDAFYFNVEEPYRFDNPGSTECTYYLTIVRKV